MQELTVADGKRLRELETVIERGQKVFLSVGRAMLEIRDSKLYRGEYATFAEYAERRWGYKLRYCQLLIASAKTVESLEAHSCAQLPDSESQVRPLSRLPEDKQADAWQDALDECAERGEPVTARAVEEVVERYEAQSVPYVDADSDPVDDDEPADEPEDKPQEQPLESFTVYMDDALSYALAQYQPHESVVQAWLENQLEILKQQ